LRELHCYNCIFFNFKSKTNYFAR